MMTTSAVLQLSGRSKHERHDAGVASDCNLQQPGDELELADNLTDAHPPGLPLPNRMHGFVTLAGLVGSPERAEALARSHCADRLLASFEVNEIDAELIELSNAIVVHAEPSQTATIELPVWVAP